MSLNITKYYKLYKDVIKQVEVDSYKEKFIKHKMTKKLNKKQKRNQGKR